MAPIARQQAVGFDLVFERVAPRLFARHPGCFSLVWALVFVVTAVVSILLAPGMSNPRAFLGLTLCQAMGLFTVPMAFRFCRQMLVEWAEGIDSFVVAERKGTTAWLLDEMSFFRGSAPMYLCGFVLAVVAVAAYFIAAQVKGDYLYGYGRVAIGVGYLVIFVSAHFAGFGIYAVYCGSRAIWRLGNRCEIRVESHKFGVLGTGRVLMKCYFAIALAWSFYVLSAVIGRAQIRFENVLEDLPMLILAVPTFVFIFGSFIICQMPIHQKMVRFKRSELLRIAESLRALEPHVTTGADKETREKFEFLHRQRAAVESLPEWPFSFRVLLGAFGSSVTSVLPVLISVLPLSDLDAVTKLLMELARPAGAP